MTTYDYSVSMSPTVLGASRPPGSMSSNQITVAGGIELLAGSIDTMKTRETVSGWTTTAANQADARDNFINHLNSLNNRTYRNAADTADVTVTLTWTNSEPTGTAWTSSTKMYLVPYQSSGGSNYLAYDKQSDGATPPTYTYRQLKAEITITQTSAARG